MKRRNDETGRSARLRALVSYPAVTVALIVCAALTLTPLHASPVMALTTSATPTDTAAPTQTPAPTTPVDSPTPLATSTTSSPTPLATSTTNSPTPLATSTTNSPTPLATSTTASAIPWTTSATPNPTPIPSAPSGQLEPGQAPVDHDVLARVEGPGFQARYLSVDAPLSGAAPFQTLRVRFTMHNASGVSLTAAPQLEYRPEGSTGFVVVPEEPVRGVPFHVAREWVPGHGLAGGTEQGPLGADITVAGFLTGNTDGALAVAGHHSMGANPDRQVTLPPGSYTEQEFTVRLTTDARYLTGYELRITDGQTALAGTRVARIRLGAPPPLRLSPGSASSSPVTEATAPAMRYPLVASTLSAAAAESSGIHGPYSMTANQCSTCHRGHAAQAPNLLVKGSQSTLCFTCHDGLGASTNVQAQYALARPVNNPAEREYYSHDALAPSTHTRSELDEFGGVSNRHSECADCHNSHKATSTDTVQTATGWEASGRLSGISGVSVVNGEAGTAPAYTFLDGVNKPVTREYQLCFKCHSGSTTLTSNAGLKPSQYMLDKAVELNPANASFHPVEAPGTNQTTKMADNLLGSSPYKLWNFTPGSTIRCLNCHASGTVSDSAPTPGSAATPDPTATPPPAAGGALPVHTSANRGILLRNYQDRVLMSGSAAYSAMNFALCYVCHGEEPFANNTASATNFSLHGKHLTGLADRGSGGTDIDTPGDGQGNAICAECHFRLHSTTNKVGAQVVPGSRLVSFAPNVQPSGGVISWTPETTGGGSCTLTCHGYTHENNKY